MRKKDSSLILIVLLVCLGLYLLWPRRDRSHHSPAVSEPKAESVELSSKQIEKNIDHYMKMGRGSEELRRDLTAIENQVQAPPIDPNHIDPRTFDPNAPIPLTLQGDDPTGKAYRDGLGKDPNARYKALTPEQRITNDIERQRFISDYERQLSEAALRKYLDDARADGWEVELDKDGYIVKRTWIGKEEPLRFPQSVDQSGKKTTPDISK